MPDHWLSFVYQYAVGGVFFFTVIFIAMKTRVLSLKSREGRGTFWMLIGGFVFFFLVHGLWIYLVTAK